MDATAVVPVCTTTCGSHHLFNLPPPPPPPFWPLVYLEVLVFADGAALCLSGALQKWVSYFPEGAAAAANLAISPTNRFVFRLVSSSLGLVSIFRPRWNFVGKKESFLDGTV